MPMTVLEAVNEYLDAVDGFRIDTLQDTDEAQRAARILRRVFYRLFTTNTDNQHEGQLRTLEPSGVSPLYPTSILLPEDIQRVQGSRVEYMIDPVKAQYKLLTYLHPEEFIDYVRGRTALTPGAQVVVVPGGVSITVLTNKQPDYWTSFDDRTLVFDSWNTEDSATIVSARCRMFVQNNTPFFVGDEFLIPLPDHLLPVLLDNFIDEAALLMRNEALPRTAQHARAGRIKLQQDHRRTGSMGSKKHKYGRR